MYIYWNDIVGGSLGWLIIIPWLLFGHLKWTAFPHVRRLEKFILASESASKDG
jgi:hypothetical protein